MKKLMLAVCSLVAAVLLTTGCKSISTRSTTHFFDGQGQEIATRKEHTHSTGLFVKGESVAIKGTLSFTNTITLDGKPAVIVGENKTFNADKITTATDAEGIKASGGAIGEAAGAIIKE